MTFMLLVNVFKSSKNGLIAVPYMGLTETGTEALSNSPIFISSGGFLPNGHRRKQFWFGTAD